MKRLVGVTFDGGDRVFYLTNDYVSEGDAVIITNSNGKGEQIKHVVEVRYCDDNIDENRYGTAKKAEPEHYLIKPVSKAQSRKLGELLIEESDKSILEIAFINYVNKNRKDCADSMYYNIDKIMENKMIEKAFDSIINQFVKGNEPIESKIVETLKPYIENIVKDVAKEKKVKLPKTKTNKVSKEIANELFYGDSFNNEIGRRAEDKIEESRDARK